MRLSPNALSPARRMALLGMLCALSVTLSFLEGLLPALPLPGARLGLSHLVTLTALSSLGLYGGFAVIGVKAGFALLRGVTAGCMSLCGGVLSVLVMYTLMRLCSRRVSLLGQSLAGAAAHNMGQLAVALLLLDGSLIHYAPWLLLLSLVTGSVTGLTAQLTVPLLRRLTGGSPL